MSYYIIILVKVALQTNNTIYVRFVPTMCEISFTTTSQANT